MTLPSLICAMSETHESQDKSKEEVCEEVETLQDCEAVTVNFRVNSLYICGAFLSLSLHLSVPVEGVKEGEVRDSAESWKHSFSWLLWDSSQRVFMGHKAKS